MVHLVSGGQLHSRPIALVALSTWPWHPGQAGGAAAGMEAGGALHLEAPSVFVLDTWFSDDSAAGWLWFKAESQREMTQLPVEGLWPAGKTFPYLPSSLEP